MKLHINQFETDLCLQSFKLFLKMQLTILSLLSKFTMLSSSPLFLFFFLVLSRVKDFLPKMKEAEEMLEKEIAEKSTSGLDIENIADGAPYIEMVRTVSMICM